MRQTVRVNFTVPKTIADELKKISAEYVQKKSRLVTEALKSYLTKLKETRIENQIKESFKIYEEENRKIAEEYSYTDAETLKNFPNDW